MPVQPGTRELETRSDCAQGFPRLQGTLNLQSAHMTADGAGAPRHALIIQPASVRTQENGVTCCLEKDKRGNGEVAEGDIGTGRRLSPFGMYVPVTVGEMKPMRNRVQIWMLALTSNSSHDACCETLPLAEAPASRCLEMAFQRILVSDEVGRKFGTAIHAYRKTVSEIPVTNPLVSGF